MASILVRREGAVGTVVLANPEKFNAMTTEMWRELPQRIAELDADPAIVASTHGTSVETVERLVHGTQSHASGSSGSESPVGVQGS